MHLIMRQILLYWEAWYDEMRCINELAVILQPSPTKRHKMNRHTKYDIIAIISTLGILAWMLTDYFGGMIIYLLAYGLIIIPIIILYIISFGNTIISLAKRGFNQNRIKVVFHGLVVLAIFLNYVFQSDILKSKRVLTATLKDDQFHYTLVFRENGTCENEIFGIFGFQEVFHGKYKFQGDTIIFSKKPYDNNFIPDTLLIDRKENAIFINKDKQGKFSTTKEWLNHFEIQ